MKKFLLLIIVLFSIFALAACSKVDPAFETERYYDCSASSPTYPTIMHFFPNGKMKFWNILSSKTEEVDYEITGKESLLVDNQKYAIENEAISNQHFNCSLTDSFTISENRDNFDIFKGQSTKIKYVSTDPNVSIDIVLFPPNDSSEMLEFALTNIHIDGKLYMTTFSNPYKNYYLLRNIGSHSVDDYLIVIDNGNTIDFYTEDFSLITTLEMTSSKIE